MIQHKKLEYCKFKKILIIIRLRMKEAIKGDAKLVPEAKSWAGTAKVRIRRVEYSLPLFFNLSCFGMKCVKERFVGNLYENVTCLLFRLDPDQKKLHAYTWIRIQVCISDTLSRVNYYMYRTPTCTFPHIIKWCTTN